MAAQEHSGEIYYMAYVSYLKVEGNLPLSATSQFITLKRCAAGQLMNVGRLRAIDSKHSDGGKITEGSFPFNCLFKIFLPVCKRWRRLFLDLGL